MNSGLLLIYSQTNTTRGWTQVYYSYIVKQTWVHPLVVFVWFYMSSKPEFIPWLCLFDYIWVVNLSSSSPGCVCLILYKHNQGMNSGLLLIYSQTNTTRRWTQVYYSYIIKQTQPGDELRFTTTWVHRLVVFVWLYMSSKPEFIPWLCLFDYIWVVNHSGLLLIYSQTNTTRWWTQVYYSYIVKQTQPGDELRFTTQVHPMVVFVWLYMSSKPEFIPWLCLFDYIWVVNLSSSPGCVCLTIYDYSYIVKQTQPGDELRFTTHI
jgi:hypothetical protein